MHPFTKLSAKDERILVLENRVDELEEQIDECESTHRRILLSSKIFQPKNQRVMYQH